MTSTSAPSQAVVLCGGLGTRLRPITDALPKPMVMVNGKPFLHHLLRQLSEQGITRFVLLTGYRGEQISDYFADGSQYGWSISYSHGPSQWDTGRRVWEARSQLDPQFLLLYSDNFVQFSLPKLQKLHQEMGTPISLLLAPKAKGNIRVSDHGRIQAYDKTRSGNGFDYVEVGYMLIDRDEILRDFPSFAGFPDFNFSALLQKLAQQREIAGLVVRDSYHSISDIDRVALMCEYLRPKKILLVDRDGTLNEKAPKGEYVTNWSQFRWIPQTRAALGELAEDGFKFIVITNQAGIARKLIEPAALQEIHANMIKQLADDGVDVLKVYMCPDHWDAESFMRKPAPGMFFQAAKEFNLRMDRCIYVGDDERDYEAAWNAGCGFVYLSRENGMPDRNSCPKPFMCAKTLHDKVEKIKNYYLSWEQQI
jgi:D-glycero-D-manno-heptose 1,7-bisphosphate phosphatase